MTPKFSRNRRAESFLAPLSEKLYAAEALSSRLPDLLHSTLSQKSQEATLDELASIDHYQPGPSNS